MGNKIFIITILCFYSCGVIQPKWIRIDTGGKQAVASAYHLSKIPFEYNALIDTALVYLAENEYVITNRKGEIIEKKHTYHDFIRFSSDGIAFSSNHIIDKPIESYFNILEKGQFCYYTVDGSLIKIELFNHDTRMFEYWYGKIQENGDILFYKRKGRPWGTYKSKLNYYYKKTPAKLTTRIVFPE